MKERELERRQHKEESANISGFADGGRGAEFRMRQPLERSLKRQGNWFSLQSPGGTQPQ